MSTTSARKIANKWIARGIPTFPIAISNDGHNKRPLTAHGHHDATLDLDVFDQQLTAAHPRGDETLAIGLHLGAAGLIAMDIDNKNGKNGYIAADALGLESNYESKTPSGGKHVWYRKPSESKISNYSPWADDGIDIRADDGWVVAPGCRCPAGAWLPEDHEWPGIDQLDVLPAEIAARLRTSNSSQTASWRQLTDADLNTIDPVTRAVFITMRDVHGAHSPTLRSDQDRTWIEVCRPGKPTGVSATIGRITPDIINIFTSNWPGLPAGTHRLIDSTIVPTTLADDLAMRAWEERSTHIADNTNDEISPLAASRVDWTTIWDEDHSTRWLCEPLLAEGRGHALYAPAKAGKSLLATYIAASIATGHACLKQPAGQPRKVLYIDLEMTRSDLTERLTTLGFRHANLEHLIWLSLPIITLDNANGAAELGQYCDQLGDIALVIIDTTARAVEGEENSADTYRRFAKHAGLELKRRGITMLRTDHAGKDADKGQRGSSAKNDDVDIVWRLTRSTTTKLKLTATHSRVGWTEPEHLLEQTTNPLRFEILANQRNPITNIDRAAAILALEHPTSARAAVQIVRAIDPTLSRRDAETAYKRHSLWPSVDD